MVSFTVFVFGSAKLTNTKKYNIERLQTDRHAYVYTYEYALVDVGVDVGVDVNTRTYYIYLSDSNQFNIDLYCFINEIHK